MWTSENRGRYDRSRLRYPTDLTDEEWALVAPLIPPASPLAGGVRSYAVDPDRARALWAAAGDMVGERRP